jgi:hypothetical protein
MIAPDGQIVSLRRQEGTLIYSDDQGRNDVTTVTFLAIARFLGRQGEDPIMQCWRSEGEITSVAESLAILYSREPGLKEVVDALYAMILKRKPA